MPVVLRSYFFHNIPKNVLAEVIFTLCKVFVNLCYLCGISGLLIFGSVIHKDISDLRDLKKSGLSVITILVIYITEQADIVSGLLVYLIVIKTAVIVVSEIIEGIYFTVIVSTLG